MKAIISSIFKTFFLSLCVIANTHFAYAQTAASILPPAKTQLLDNNGKPLVSGTVDYYVPGTTTRKTTWQDSGKTIANTNPVVLDGGGRALMLGDGSYRQVVKDRLGNIIWDQVTNSSGSGGGGTTATVGDGQPVGSIQLWAGMVAPAQYAFAYGQEFVRASNPELFAALTTQQNVSCTLGNATLTGLTNTQNIPIGSPIESACLNSGSTVISKTTTTVVASANAIISTNSSARFFPYGNGDGSLTFNGPDLRGKVPVGRCNMGGIDCSNLNSTYYGSNPSALGANGGSQSTTLLTANFPPYTPSGSISSPTTVNNAASTTTLSSSNIAYSTGGSNNNFILGTVTGATTTVTSTFAGTAQGGTSTPISRISPSLTTNYVIKITPDSNPNSFFGVASIGGMTGIITCGVGLTCAGNSISSLAATTPPPTPLTLGGVYSYGPITNQFLTGVDTTGTILSAQVNFNNLAGSIAAGQIPVNSITNAMLSQMSALSVKGNSTNTTSNAADISASTDGNILRRSGASLGFGPIDLSSIGSVGSSILSVTNGGTGAATLSSGNPLLGNGTGPIQSGSISGNTTVFPTVTGALTPGNCVKVGPSGGISDAGATCGANSNTPNVQTFISPANFTPGTTTALTLSSSPSTSLMLTITFDGVVQAHNTWSLAGAIVTFNAAIPLNTQVVEAQWYSPSTTAGVGSLSVQGDPIAISGAAVLAPGAGTAMSRSGQTITIGNSTKVVSIQDAAYGAKCDALSIQSGGILGMAAGSPTLTYTVGNFTTADVGKSIWVPGAGTAGAGLSSSILSVTNSTTVVLANNAVTAIGGPPTISAPFVYGTNDTTAIQTAMNAVPVGGTLWIPSGAGGIYGCLIKQQGANNYALLQDRPYNIKGQGHFSILMTDPSIPSTVDNLVVQVGPYDWAGITWESFNIGDYPTFLPASLRMYTRHGKRGLALVDAAFASYIGIKILNMTIGESGNDYSLYMGNPSGGHSQFGIIEGNKIWGGINLENVADSNRIVRNVLQGSSTFGGMFSFVSGAAGFEFHGNNVTWAGGMTVQSGTKPSVMHNYFEELYPTSQPNNAMVDFNGGVGTIVMPIFKDNIVNAGVSTTSIPVRYNNAGPAGNFGDNYIATSNARTGVISTTTLSCTAPNAWVNVGTHFSTALANTYGGC